MAQAKTLEKPLYARLRDMLDRISHRVELDRVILSLSFKAGLRSAEMAGLKWADLCNPFGHLIIPGETFKVRGETAKYGAARTIPMHPELYADLKDLIARFPAAAKLDMPVLAAPRGHDAAFASNTLQRYIGRLYRKAGMYGMSSHSGRRTFGTTLARTANSEDCSLRDVSRLLGHRHMQTTEGYIEYSEGVKALVTKL